jgi:hypothetical protein
MEEQSIYDAGGNPPEPRLSLVDLIYGLLFAPTATFQKISARPPLSQAFIIFTAVTLIGTLLSVWTPPVAPELPSEVPPEMGRMMSSMMPYMGLLTALFAFVGWFVLAGVFQLVSEFFEGRGTALGVLTVLGLSELPNVFAGPLFLLAALLGSPVLTTFITVSSGLLIFIWRFILIVIGLREIQGYSTGKAVLTVLAPGIVLFLVILVTVIALAGMMVSVIPYISK